MYQFVSRAFTDIKKSFRITYFPDPWLPQGLAGLDIAAISMLKCLTCFFQAPNVPSVVKNTIAGCQKGCGQFRDNMIIPVWHSLHELIQQVIIGGASHSLVPQSDVERILQQRLEEHMQAEGRARWPVGLNPEPSCGGVTVLATALLVLILHSLVARKGLKRHHSNSL